jgi:hypothetical protein
MAFCLIYFEQIGFVRHRLYRSLDELGRAIAALHGAENAASRRPGVTLVQFSR